MVMKRFIPIILCIILALSVCVSGAETEEETSIPAVTEEFPMPEGAEPPQMPPDGERMGGGRHGGGQPPQMQGSENAMSTDMGNVEGSTNEDTTQSDAVPDDAQMQQPSGGRGGFGGSGGGMGMMPEDFQQQGDMATQTGTKSILQFAKEYSTPIISVILLFLAFPFVIFYRKKNY